MSDILFLVFFLGVLPLVYFLSRIFGTNKIKKPSSPVFESKIIKFEHSDDYHNPPASLVIYEDGVENTYRVLNISRKDDYFDYWELIPFTDDELKVLRIMNS